MNIKDIKTDYRHFRGDVTYKLHKQYGVYCLDEKENNYKCMEYPHPDKVYSTIEELFSK